MPKLDIPPEGPELTWHTMRDWLYKLWLNVKGLTFGADSSTYSSAILSAAGQGDGAGQTLLGLNGAWPAFNALKGTSQTTTTSAIISSYSSTPVNTNSCFNGSTGIFTTPVAGLYFFMLSVTPDQSSGSVAPAIAINKNGSNYTEQELGYGSIFNAFSVQAAMLLAPGDTVTAFMQANNAQTFTLLRCDFTGFMIQPTQA